MCTASFFWMAALLPWGNYALSIAPPPMKVLVTGASGKTGRLVFEALLEDPTKFKACGLVRSVQSAKALRKMVSNTGLDQIVICDITVIDDGNDKTNNNNVPSGLDGCDAMIICTSAMPVINKLSLARAFLKAPINMIRGKKAFDFRSLKFDWKGGQYPEKVDYQGQKAQIDLAIKLGMKHVVIVGSMGGTDPSNFLNSIGKNKDGTGNGDILLWKRKAEKYLVEQAKKHSLDYTIIHPGGLKDDPPGEKKFVLDVDDKLIQRQQKSISRADVASLCLASLTVGKGQKVALDVITADRNSQEPPDSTASTGQTAEEALQDFLAKKRVYEYA
ncbi:hypothetical protein ACA910_016689 [Epithemia clementina (nom. ined.)]